MVFIAHTGGGNEAPLTVKNLDTAEMISSRRRANAGTRRALPTELESEQVSAWRPDRRCGAAMFGTQDRSLNRPVCWPNLCRLLVQPFRDFSRQSDYNAASGF